MLQTPTSNTGTPLLLAATTPPAWKVHAASLERTLDVRSGSVKTVTTRSPLLAKMRAQEKEDQLVRGDTPPRGGVKPASARSLGDQVAEPAAAGAVSSTAEAAANLNETVRMDEDTTSYAIPPPPGIAMRMPPSFAKHSLKTPQKRGLFLSGANAASAAASSSGLIPVATALNASHATAPTDVAPMEESSDVDTMEELKRTPSRTRRTAARGAASASFSSAGDDEASVTSSVDSGGSSLRRSGRVRKAPTAFSPEQPAADEVSSASAASTSARRSVRRAK